MKPKKDADVSTEKGELKALVTSETTCGHTKERKVTYPDGNGHSDERKEEVVCCGSDREMSAFATPDNHSKLEITVTPEVIGATIKKEPEVCNEAKREIHMKKT